MPNIHADPTRQPNYM